MMFSSRTSGLGVLLNAASLININLIMAAFDNGSKGIDLTWFTNSLVTRRYLALGFVFYDEWPRIRSFFFGDAAVVPPKPDYVWTKAWMKRAVLGAQMLFVVRVLHVLYVDVADPWLRAGYRSAVEAVYDVRQFTRNGSVVPDSLEASRWGSVAVFGCLATVRKMSGEIARFSLAPRGNETSCLSPWHPRFKNLSRRNYPMADTLTYTLVNPNELTLSGIITTKASKDTIVAILGRVPDDQIPLMDRHWFWTRTREVSVGPPR
jgi:hypothetical protein